MPEPEEPQADQSFPRPPAFEAPHSNGAAHASQPDGRGHPPWEFMILALLVALLCIGIVVAWTVVGSHSPERLDVTSATAAARACEKAQTALKALPNPDPRLGADRVARIRAENDELRTMVAELGAVQPVKTTPARALRSWTADWSRMIDARARYADDLEASARTGAKVRFITPAVNAIKPITGPMDDFVRENHPHLDACFTEALQIERVEGAREYKKVTS